MPEIEASANFLGSTTMIIDQPSQVCYEGFFQLLFAKFFVQFSSVNFWSRFQCFKEVYNDRRLGGGLWKFLMKESSEHFLTKFWKGSI